jgi:hypothetical protein
MLLLNLTSGNLDTVQKLFGVCVLAIGALTVDLTRVGKNGFIQIFLSVNLVNFRLPPSRIVEKVIARDSLTSLMSTRDALGCLA